MPEYRVVNKYDAPCVLLGGLRTTTNRSDADKACTWWDQRSPQHAPHRVVEHADA